MTKRKVRVVAPVVELERLNVAAATPQGDLYAWTWTGALKQHWTTPNSGALLVDQVDVGHWMIGGENLERVLDQFEGAMVNITISRVLDG